MSTTITAHERYIGMDLYTFATKFSPNSFPFSVTPVGLCFFPLGLHVYQCLA